MLKKDYAYTNNLKPEIVLTSNNLQLLKYSDENGNTTFTIKTLDGTILAENISRLELRNDFPEIEKNYESWYHTIEISDGTTVNNGSAIVGKVYKLGWHF